MLIVSLCVYNKNLFFCFFVSESEKLALRIYDTTRVGYIILSNSFVWATFVWNLEAFLELDDKSQNLSRHDTIRTNIY
jgi:hypothetical protein